MHASRFLSSMGSPDLIGSLVVRMDGHIYYTEEVTSPVLCLLVEKLFVDSHVKTKHKLRNDGKPVV